MKRWKRLSGMGAILAAAVFMMISCSSGGGSSGSDKITETKAVAGMEALQGIVDIALDNAPEPSQAQTIPDFSAGTYPAGFTVAQSNRTSTSITLTITLADFSPPAEGEETPPMIVGNGTLTVKISVNNDWSRVTFVITGSITASGIDAKFSTLAADCTISCPYVNDELDDPDQLSGTITVDGKSYDISKIEMNSDSIPDPLLAHYLIPGGENTPVLAYSATGEVWRHLTLSGGSGQLRAGARNPATGRIVVVGDNGMIYYSDDKAQWTKIGSGLTTARLKSVAYANNVWVAAGFYTNTPQRGEILVSNDGITWSKKGPFLSDESDGSGELWTVAFGGTGWLAGGIHMLYSGSADGGIWTDVTPTSIPDALFINSLAHKNGTWYAGTGHWWGSVGESFGAIYASNDGVNWTKEYTDTSNSRPVNSIFIGSGVFVAVAGKLWFEPGASFSILTSADGANWTESVVSGVKGAGLSVTGDPDGFIAMSAVGGIVRINGSGSIHSVVKSEGYGGGGIMYVP